MIPHQSPAKGKNERSLKTLQARAMAAASAAAARRFQAHMLRVAAPRSPMTLAHLQKSWLGKVPIRSGHGWPPYLGQQKRFCSSDGKDAAALAEELATALNLADGKDVVMGNATARQLVKMVKSSHSLPVDSASAREVDARINKIEASLSILVTGGLGIVCGLLLYVVALPAGIYHVKHDVSAAKEKVTSLEARVADLERAENDKSSRKMELQITVTPPASPDTPAAPPITPSAHPVTSPAPSVGI